MSSRSENLHDFEGPVRRQGSHRPTLWRRREKSRGFGKNLEPCCGHGVMVTTGLLLPPRAGTCSARSLPRPCRFLSEAGTSDGLSRCGRPLRTSRVTSCQAAHRVAPLPVAGLTAVPLEVTLPGAFARDPEPAPEPSPTVLLSRVNCGAALS